MRLTAVTVFAFSVATAAVAQLTPGYVVRTGEPFPIVADFNGDGLDDLIQERTVILNNGATLADERDLGLAKGDRVIGILDVNGDRLFDLLTVQAPAAAPVQYDPSGGSRTYQYRLYIANTARNYPATGIDITTGPQPYVADADGDGKDDLILMNDVRPDGFRTVATQMTVLRSKGDGTFERLPPVRIAPSPQIVPDYRVLTGDLNHDGLPDMVVRCPDDLVILRGTGGGHFVAESRYLPMSPDYGWWSARLADIDGDSNLDVIIPGFRNIRIFFGDGHGNFPRMTRTMISKVRDAVFPPTVPDLGLDRMNQPRDIAIGHFTRTEQTQIAAGMGEGDLVVFAYQQGALKEVSRTPTEYWLLDIRAGSIRNSGLDDLYVMGTLIWGDMYPRPRLFYGSADTAGAANDTVVRFGGRGRASRPPAAASALQMQLRGECVDEISDRWNFSRDGVFGLAQREDASMEAVFDGATIYYRLNAPYAKDTVKGELVQSDGVYSGTAIVLTSCGWKTLNVTARAE